MRKLCAVEEPKTSEYAFYMKLRKDAGRNFHSYPHKKQDNSSNNFEANNSIRGSLFKEISW